MASRTRAVCSHQETVRTAFQRHDLRSSGLVGCRQAETLLNRVAFPSLGEEDRGRLSRLLSGATDQRSDVLSYESLVNWIFAPELLPLKPPQGAKPPSRSATPRSSSLPSIPMQEPPSPPPVPPSLQPTTLATLPPPPRQRRDERVPAESFGTVTDFPYPARSASSPSSACASPTGSVRESPYEDAAAALVGRAAISTPALPPLIGLGLVPLAGSQPGSSSGRSTARTPGSHRSHTSRRKSAGFHVKNAKTADEGCPTQPCYEEGVDAASMREILPQQDLVSHPKVDEVSSNQSFDFSPLPACQDGETRSTESVHRNVRLTNLCSLYVGTLYTRYAAHVCPRLRLVCSLYLGALYKRCVFPRVSPFAVVEGSSLQHCSSGATGTDKQQPSIKKKVVISSVAEVVEVDYLSEESPSFMSSDDDFEMDPRFGVEDELCPAGFLHSQGNPGAPPWQAARSSDLSLSSLPVSRSWASRAEAQLNREEGMDVTMGIADSISRPVGVPPALQHDTQQLEFCRSYASMLYGDSKSSSLDIPLALQHDIEQHEFSRPYASMLYGDSRSWEPNSYEPSRRVGDSSGAFDSENQRIAVDSSAPEVEVAEGECSAEESLSFFSSEDDFAVGTVDEAGASAAYHDGQLSLTSRLTLLHPSDRDQRAEESGVELLALPTAAWASLHIRFRPSAGASDLPTVTCRSTAGAATTAAMEAAVASLAICQEEEVLPTPRELAADVAYVAAAEFTKAALAFASTAAIAPCASSGVSESMTAIDAARRQTRNADDDQTPCQNPSDIDEVDAALMAAVLNGETSQTCEELLALGADPTQPVPCEFRLELFGTSSPPIGKHRLRELSYASEWYESAVVGVRAAAVKRKDRRNQSFYFELEAASIVAGAAVGIIWAVEGARRVAPLSWRLGPNGVHDFMPSDILSAQLPLAAFLDSEGIWSMWQYNSESKTLVCCATRKVKLPGGAQRLGAAVDFEAEKVYFAIDGAWTYDDALSLRSISSSARASRVLIPAAFATHGAAVTFCVPIGREGSANSWKKSTCAAGAGLAAFAVSKGDSLTLAAARAGSWDVARSLLRFGLGKLPMEERERETRRRSSADGRTLLHYACAVGDVEFVQDLLFLGARKRAHDDAGMLPAELAVLNAHVDAAKATYSGVPARECSALCQVMLPLLLRPGERRGSGAALEAALRAASVKGHGASIRLILDAGTTVDAAHEDGTTPLLLASKAGHLDCCRLLLDRGARVKMETSRAARVPLMQAAKEGHYEVVGLLLDHGASITAEVVMAAVRAGHAHVAKRLLERNGSPHDILEGGWTPLHVASQNGRVAVVDVLLTSRADLNACTASGWTPLHVVAQNGAAPTAAKLLENRADTNKMHNEGALPIHVAIRNRHDVVVQLLAERRC